MRAIPLTFRPLDVGYCCENCILVNLLTYTRTDPYQGALRLTHAGDPQGGENLIRPRGHVEACDGSSDGHPAIPERLNSPRVRRFTRLVWN